MHIKNILLLSTFGLMIFSSNVNAQSYEIEAAHSSIGFSVRHLGISNVKGTFGKFSGIINYDPAKPEATSVEAEIDTSSINTENKKRDDHVRSKDFLNSTIFPKMTFKSTSVKVESPNSMIITGDLKILNFSKPIELKVTDIVGPVENPMDKKMHIGASVSGQLKRQDYGVTWSGSGVTGAAGEAAIGDIIKFDFEIDGIAK